MNDWKQGLRELKELSRTATMMGLIVFTLAAIFVAAPPLSKTEQIQLFLGLSIICGVLRLNLK